MSIDFETASGMELSSWYARHPSILNTESFAALRDAIVAQVRQGEPERIRVAQREAASKAWDVAANNFIRCEIDPNAMQEEGMRHRSDKVRARYLAGTYPDPAPSVVLSDGSVVSVTRNSAGSLRLMRGAGRDMWIPQDWRALLRDFDTGADFDALKALAATVEGR